MPLPKFLIKRVPKQRNINKIRQLIQDCHIHTVCESAKCPNIGECFSKQTLTFMILGNTCTRNCAFCGINSGVPLPPDPEEPVQIAKAVKKINLDYVVITSVTRDDLADGGAGQFRNLILEIRKLDVRIKTEVLIPDFQGNEQALETVIAAHPYVINHNVETSPRLYSKIRPQANYQQSLELLRRVKQKNRGLYTKSGFMVGLGESQEEVSALLGDLHKVGCDIVTIGQYLPPSKAHLQAVRYVEPKEFDEYIRIGEKLGLKVKAGPFVRSSYQANETI
ncbi:MAG: lipoyl synthase [bacterium]